MYSDSRMSLMGICNRYLDMPKFDISLGTIKDKAIHFDKRKKSRKAKKMKRGIK